MAPGFKPENRGFAGRKNEDDKVVFLFNFQSVMSKLCTVDEPKTGEICMPTMTPFRHC
jgi:hypothetical protein